MKRILMLLLGLSVAGALVSAQSSKPMDLYQEGLYLQEVKGDLRKAIEVYQSIVTRYASDRAVTSKALFQLANCYEKLGQPEASTTYQRLVREFPDAGDVTAAARTKLSALRPARTQGLALEPRKIGPVGSYYVADLSPTGAQTVGTEGTDIVIRDVSSGQRTVLVAASSGHQGFDPVFSLDGRQVAYEWRPLAGLGAPPVASGPSLQIIGTERGAKPRTLVGAGGMFREITPVGWSPDGKSIVSTTVTGAALPFTQTLVSISIADGAVRVLGSLGDPRGRSRLRLSPDGRFLTYSAFQSAAEPLAFVSATNRPPSRLFLASLESFAEAEIVKTVGSHTDPVWTPDGSHVMFLSTRLDRPALWAVPVQGGRAVGDPSVVLAGFQFRPLAVTSAGSLFYVETRVPTVQTHIVDRGGRLVTSFPGAGGDWSPNGRYFAFKPVLGAGSEVVVRDMDTAAERSYRLENMNSASPHWLGNDGFVVGANQGAAGETLYFCDVTTGAFRPLYPARTAEFQRWGFTMPDDGSRIYSLFKSGVQGAPLTGVVGVDPATGTNGPVATFPTPLRPAMPGVDVNRNGTAVVLMATPLDSLSTARLFVMGIDGSGYREVGAPFPVSRTPDLVRFTSDGASILYVTTSNGKSRVMRIPMSGGSPEFQGVEVDGPIWNIDPSPDGTRIAYSTTPPPTADLWAVDNIMAAVAGR